MMESAGTTIGDIFFRCAAKYGELPLLAVPANGAREYAPQGMEITYEQAERAVRSLMSVYVGAGYGVGHRIGLLLQNRPEHLLHKLAVNALGICCVPLNPDYRPQEIAYVVNHARIDLVVVEVSLRPLLEQAITASMRRPAIVELGHFPTDLPAAEVPAISVKPTEETIASILYTSGSTGRPKGCLLSHRYEIAAGEWYNSRGGLASLGEACERIYNPLPLFHVNASIYSFFGALLHGNCQIQTDRFHPLRWWSEVHQTRATVVHYLGVIVPMLLNQPSHDLENAHRVRFGIGAGVDPQRHAEFEQRFGFPLLEVWGMTEMVRAFVDCDEPRRVGTRAIGRVKPGLEARVVNEGGEDVGIGEPGELLVRHSRDTPRKDFFSGYLDDVQATEYAWRGGWFHTGDIVLRDPDGLMHFVDRRKNIIRRSGENIAAAEVEGLLQTHEYVQQAAVIAVMDEVRGEEVLACVVLKPEAPMGCDTVARILFDYCNAALAYYKAPGWIWFTDRIPTTSTQKVQKHQIFDADVDPRVLDGMIDLRSLKKRRALPVDRKSERP